MLERSSLLFYRIFGHTVYQKEISSILLFYLLKSNSVSACSTKLVSLTSHRVNDRT